ncbi:Fe-S cluster assembly protein HesB [Nocardioides sp. TF02-7]|uniref:Fe-S cluster assembly protein HesB n=1 Tax=Nocardioides sp. TF02-7 TaxID=2917724 RepID=UPI001F06D7C6|nr:Fe-S cluster assembly protein HesB [Nocardioides sp. TF02-7]UMG92481.1 Fe-S cluster assembly protein HesB [Nocardioides sp. TF02-7]
MLTLTDNACTIVKQFTDHPDVPAEAGLRISSTPDAQLSVAAAEAPADGDQVVEQDGAKVYLDADAAEQLSDMVLDAGLDETGNLQFGLMAQEA